MSTNSSAVTKVIESHANDLSTAASQAAQELKSAAENSEMVVVTLNNGQRDFHYVIGVTDNDETMVLPVGRDSSVARQTFLTAIKEIGFTFRDLASAHRSDLTGHASSAPSVPETVEAALRQVSKGMARNAEETVQQASALRTFGIHKGNTAEENTPTHTPVQGIFNRPR